MTTKNQTSTQRILKAQLAALDAARQDPPRRLRHTIDEAAELLRISRASLYDRIRRGLLLVVKDGGRTFVLGSEIDRYLVAPSSVPSGSVMPLQTR
jgi:excisionase family DNA binding protein